MVLLSVPVNGQVVRCMSGGSDTPRKSDQQVVTEGRTRVSDIPVPEGSWQEHREKKNSRWNIYLAASAAVLGISAYAVSVHFPNVIPSVSN